MMTIPRRTEQGLDIDQCSSCRADVIWATTKKTGSAIPLDAASVDPGMPGALVLIGRTAFGPTAARDFLDGEGRFTESTSDWPWHLTHFATCPYANFHRRRRT